MESGEQLHREQLQLCLSLRYPVRRPLTVLWQYGCPKRSVWTRDVPLRSLPSSVMLWGAWERGRWQHQALCSHHAQL